eukprot:Hpha_TRINITY_DN15065_c3_g2::TRINITY_DN15065_c3_g2_i1::g.125079::m.125079
MASDGFTNLQQPQGGEAQQQPQRQGGITYGGKHPGAAFFHCIFKIAAIVTYEVFGYLMSGSFAGVFVASVILLAADFWTTKNVAGRVLVGLRWWNKVNPDGRSEWMFESLPDRSVVNSFDSFFFWGVLWVNVLFWGFAFFFTLLSPTNWRWLPCCAVGFALGGANLTGYMKCKKDYKKQATAYAARVAMENPDLAVQAAQVAFNAQQQPQQQPQQQQQ